MTQHETLSIRMLPEGTKLEPERASVRSEYYQHYRTPQGLMAAVPFRYEQQHVQLPNGHRQVCTQWFQDEAGTVWLSLRRAVAFMTGHYYDIDDLTRKECRKDPTGLRVLVAVNPRAENNLPGSSDLVNQRRVIKLTLVEQLLEQSSVKGGMRSSIAEYLRAGKVAFLDWQRSQTYRPVLLAELKEVDLNRMGGGTKAQPVPAQLEPSPSPAPASPPPPETDRVGLSLFNLRRELAEARQRIAALEAELAARGGADVLAQVREVVAAIRDTGYGRLDVDAGLDSILDLIGE